MFCINVFVDSKILVPSCKQPSIAICFITPLSSFPTCKNINVKNEGKHSMAGIFVISSHLFQSLIILSFYIKYIKNQQQLLFTFPEYNQCMYNISLLILIFYAYICTQKVIRIIVDINIIMIIYVQLNVDNILHRHGVLPYMNRTKINRKTIEASYMMCLQMFKLKVYITPHV